VSICKLLRRTVFDRVTAKLQDFPHFIFPRRSLAVACLLLACLIGYVDYLTGYERSLPLFYLLPISLAAWFSGFRFSPAIVVVCVVVSIFSDVAAGVPTLRFWNIVMSFGFYALFAGVLWKLGTRPYNSQYGCVTVCSLHARLCRFRPR